MLLNNFLGFPLLMQPTTFSHLIRNVSPMATKGNLGEQLTVFNNYCFNKVICFWVMKHEWDRRGRE